MMTQDWKRGRHHLIDFSFTGGALPSGASFARASVKRAFNASGLLAEAANNAAGFDHDPVTLALRGLLIEPQRTNGIRNAALQGSAGAWPTNWSHYSTTTGLSYERTYGTEYGAPYFDLRVYGTPTGTWFQLFEESGTAIAASIGDVVTHSAFVRLSAGSLANVSAIKIGLQECNSGGGYLNASSSARTVTNALSSDPIQTTRTFNQATVAYARPYFEIAYTSGAPIDFTLRFYAPQVELGATASSRILTTGAAATRAADELSFVIPSGVSALRYTFDDNTTQDVSVGAGAYTVPTDLNRPHIKRIISL